MSADGLLCIYCRRRFPELVIDPDLYPSVAMCADCYAKARREPLVRDEVAG